MELHTAGQTGTCVACHAPIPLKSDGRLAQHGLPDRPAVRCTGSGDFPLVEIAAEPEPKYDLLAAAKLALCYMEFGSTPRPGYGAARQADISILRKAIATETERRLAAYKPASHSHGCDLLG